MGKKWVLLSEGNVKKNNAGMISLMLPNGAAKTTLDAQNVALSRAEVMFGQGTVISNQDWFAARDGGTIVPVVW